MKVLQVINSLATGGAEKLLVDSTSLYIQLGVSVDVLILSNEDDPLFYQELKSKNINIFSLGKGSVYNPLHIFRIISYLRKYDIIHVHLFPSLYWVAIAKMLSFSKIKLVYTEHSTNNKRRTAFFRFFDKLIYKKYDKLACISEKATENLSNYLGKTKDTITINNGVNLNAINDAEPSVDLPEGIIKLIMVARFQNPKDHNTVIRSLLYLSENVHAFFVGDGQLLGNSKKLAHSLKLEKKVHFLGLRNDVPRLLKASDIIVLASHWEGLSLSSIEGMAVGKPFLASNVDGLKQVVEGAGILFDDGNEKELAEKIDELLNDNEYYNQIATKCLERSKQYDINKMVAEYINLYEEILDNN